MIDRTRNRKSSSSIDVGVGDGGSGLQICAVNGTSRRASIIRRKQSAFEGLELGKLLISLVTIKGVELENLVKHGDVGSHWFLGCHG